MLGTIIGDIVGSAYEFHNYRNKGFEPFFHKDARFTDDTVCTIAVADAILNEAHPEDALVKWCRAYAENGGWGKQFALWFMADQRAPYNSWGNGAAMRISPVGFLANSEDQVTEWSDVVSGVTHNHPEAMASAQAVALTVFWARNKVPAGEIRSRISGRFDYDLDTPIETIRASYVRTERAKDSVPQAINCALQASSFEDAIRSAVSIGGDSDTIAAIAGGIAEAMFGLPEEIAGAVWKYLPEDMRGVVNDFYSAKTP
jgi:ADP-ribosyl-[dinitrogen reductase] hydrolase